MIQRDLCSNCLLTLSKQLQISVCRTGRITLTASIKSLTRENIICNLHQPNTGTSRKYSNEYKPPLVMSAVTPHWHFTIPTTTDNKQQQQLICMITFPNQRQQLLQKVTDCFLAEGLSFLKPSQNLSDKF